MSLGPLAAATASAEREQETSCFGEKLPKVPAQTSYHLGAAQSESLRGKGLLRVQLQGSRVNTAFGAG